MMARGKHGQQAANRKAQAHQARVAALRAEIAAEEQLIAEIEAEVAGVELTREQYAQAVVARDAETASEVAHLRRESDLLLELANTAREAQEQIRHRWERVSARAIDANGGGRTGIEWFMRAIGSGGFLVNDVSVGLARATRLQKIRGEREELPEVAVADIRGDDPRLFLTLLRPHYQQAWADAGLPTEDPVDHATLTGEQRRVYQQVSRAAKAARECRPSSLDIDSLGAWHPLPLILDMVGTRDTQMVRERVLLTELGALVGDAVGTEDETHVAAVASGEGWPPPTSALSAATRRRLASSPVEDAVASWRPALAAGEAISRLLGPAHGALRAGPHHPRPGRAASLRHLYAKSALGSWVRSQDLAFVGGGSGSAASPETERGGRVWGQLGVGLLAAAPFWVPRGQTYAFAHSEPLTDSDVSELRLPFPQVFLAFADPIRIAPRRPARTARDIDTGERDVSEVEVLRELDGAAALARDGNQSFVELMHGLSDPLLFGVVDVGTVLDVRGAHVEGLMVLSDSLGRVDDLFAWCVSIPSGAEGTLGRHVIPARLTGTAHRALVENLVAVAAWADWHAPDSGTAIPAGTSTEKLAELLDTPDFRRSADRSGAGGVRVLNVRSTVKAPGAGEGEPTRHVAPHVRRGHWRRQRFGPGGTQVRRVRIAPVIVNAHRGDGQPRIYQLPTAAAGLVPGTVEQAPR